MDLAVLPSTSACIEKCLYSSDRLSGAASRGRTFLVKGPAYARSGFESLAGCRLACTQHSSGGVVRTELNAELRQLRLVLPTLIDNEDPDAIREAFVGYGLLIAERTGVDVATVLAAITSLLADAGIDQQGGEVRHDA